MNPEQDRIKELETLVSSLEQELKEAKRTEWDSDDWRNHPVLKRYGYTALFNAISAGVEAYEKNSLSISIERFSRALKEPRE